MFRRKFTDEPTLAELEINALGLTMKGLTQAILAADRERALKTLNHPKGYPLIVMNAELAKSLRDVFCDVHEDTENEWQNYEGNNQPGIVSSSRKLIIVPCNFDKNCCNSAREPTNISVKGSASKRHAQCNSTGWLFDPDPYQRPTPNDQYTRWVLGTYYCEETDKLFAELSCPDGFEGGQYTSFKHRIPLPVDNERLGDVDQTQPENHDPTEFVDIPIVRK